MLNSYECHTLSISGLEKKGPHVTRTEFKLCEVNQAKEHCLLYGVLSDKECNSLIQQTEKLGYHSLRNLYSSSYRSNHRVIITDEAAAKQIWERVKHLVPSEYIDHWNKKWKAIGLNEQFRFCRYTPGQHFSPHMDASFRRNEKEESMFTFMMYLNGGFEGGATNFLYRSKVDYATAPKTGMAPVFDHRMLHEGEELGTGLKYIMRTDVMFRVCDEDGNIDTTPSRAEQRKSRFPGLASGKGAKAAAAKAKHVAEQKKQRSKDKDKGKEESKGESKVAVKDAAGAAGAGAGAAAATAGASAAASTATASADGERSDGEAEDDGADDGDEDFLAEAKAAAGAIGGSTAADAEFEADTSRWDDDAKKAGGSSSGSGEAKGDAKRSLDAAGIWASHSMSGGGGSGGGMKRVARAGGINEGDDQYGPDPDAIGRDVGGGKTASAGSAGAAGAAGAGGAGASQSQSSSGGAAVACEKKAEEGEGMVCY